VSLRFLHPELFVLVLLAALVLVLRQRRAGIAFSGFALAISHVRSSHGWLLHRILVAAGILLLTVALARPQYGHRIVENTSEGRDLTLVIDLSSSMIVDDMYDESGERIDRLHAVVSAAHGFVEGRPNDRIGLVFFASHAMTSCPPTTDHETLRQFLDRTEAQQRNLWRRHRPFQMPVGILGPGTNLGLGIGTALRSISEIEAEGKAIILITDGRDSRELPNWVDPLLAAEKAQALEVRVHGIGVGDPEGTMTDFVYRDRTGSTRFVDLRPEFLPDMARLEEITGISGGVAMHADDREELEEIFARINELEPSPTEIVYRERYSARFYRWLRAGLLVLALAMLLETPLRGIP